MITVLCKHLFIIYFLFIFNHSGIYAGVKGCRMLARLKLFSDLSFLFQWTLGCVHLAQLAKAQSRGTTRMSRLTYISLERIVANRATVLWLKQLVTGTTRMCSLQAFFLNFQLTWVSSQCADKTGSKPALFQRFYKAYRGDTEANAANNLKSAIRQKGNVFYLPSLSIFFFTCLPVPSVLSELAILSVSLSLDDFFSPFPCVCVSGCLSPSQPPPLSLSLSLRGSLWSYQSLHRGRQWCCMAFLCLLMS